jgi:hypothetical protein
MLTRCATPVWSANDATGAGRGGDRRAVLGSAHGRWAAAVAPPLLAVVTAIIGMFLAAGGGRIARAQRERAGLQALPPDD